VLKRNVCCYIQGDSGEKANILGGDNIGHCEKKAYMKMFLCDYIDTPACIKSFRYSMYFYIFINSYVLLHFVF